MKGNIFDIYRGTTHDGPGLRSTVFFRGCSLHCGWCHNPESILTMPWVWWEANRCIGCGLCVNNCPAGAISAEENGIRIRNEDCRRCGNCAAGCPSKALEVISREYTPEEVFQTLLKDKDYYSQFQGGVTASGGEALLQADFVKDLFQMLKAEGIHTALDTCGHIPFAAFEKVLPYTDCVLYDLKLADSQLHRQHTGADNRWILENFFTLMEGIRSGEFACAVWIRTPLIPGATATEQNIRQIGRLISPYLGKQISRWELCAFNNICAKKYQKLRMDWPYQNVPLLTELEAQQLRQAAREEAGDPVILTGMLR